MLTLERLREVLSYNPETGDFHWVVSKRGTFAGSLAGSLDRQGYRTIRIDNKTHRAHRLAWLYVHGKWPPEFIDHINLDKADNRLANLREATSGQNRCNVPVRSHCRAKLKGVSPNNGLYMANITVNKVRHYLGTFRTPAEAHAAYCVAATAMRGEFARHA